MTNLKQRNFADDGVVDVHGDVQPHLGRKLHQQFLFVCKQEVLKSNSSHVLR